MADIDIVPKRRTNVWVWLIVAAVIALLLWMVLAGGDRAPNTGLVQSPAAQLATAAFDRISWSC